MQKRTSLILIMLSITVLMAFAGCSTPAKSSPMAKKIQNDPIVTPPLYTSPVSAEARNERRYDDVTSSEQALLLE